MNTWRVIIVAAAVATAGGALAGCGVSRPAAAGSNSPAAGSPSPAAVSSRSPVAVASTGVVSSPSASAAVISLAASAPVPFTGDEVGLTVQASAGPGTPNWLRLASVTVSFGDGTAGTASQACSGSHAAPAAKGLTVSHAYSRTGLFTTQVTSATICGQAGQPNLAYVTQAVQVLPSAPAASASWPQCTRDEVQISVGSTGFALGHAGVLFTLHNTSAAGCRLFGYPGLGLLGPGGQPLPTTVNRAVSGTYLFPAVVPHWVALAPGRYASFDLEYEDNPWGAQSSEPYAQACPAASQTEVTLPNAYDFSVVPADMAPCNGDVWVSPVIPGRARLQFP